MKTIIIIVVILFILYKIGDADEKKKQAELEVDDDDDLMEDDYITYEDAEILEWASDWCQSPCKIDKSMSVYELTEMLINYPLKVEKLVDTVVMLEDCVRSIYIEKGCVHIALGDGKYYGTSQNSGMRICNEYICKIEDELDEDNEYLENIKEGDYVKVIGVLQREYSGSKYPQVLDEAEIVEINFDIRPRVTVAIERYKSGDTLTKFMEDKFIEES